MGEGRGCNRRAAHKITNGKCASFEPTQSYWTTTFFFLARKDVSCCLLSMCTPEQCVICYGSGTQWVWFKSTPLHCDLGRRGGAGKSERCCQSWPEHWPCHGPTFSLLFLSLSAAPVVVFSIYKRTFPRFALGSMSSKGLQHNPSLKWLYKYDVV